MNCLINLTEVTENYTTLVIFFGQSDSEKFILENTVRHTEEKPTTQKSAVIRGVCSTWINLAASSHQHGPHGEGGQISPYL